MKHLIPLFLVLSLLLCACGGPGEETTAIIETTAEATTAATTEATTEATTAPVAIRHPLTGEKLDAPFTGRPTAIVINNLVDALPHYGVSQADMLYEIETEGGITRMLAIFSDFTDVGSIGPVRSNRSFFNNVAASYDAPVIHCGGSPGGLNGWYDSSADVISNWEHINEQFNGSYFFRDRDRYNYQGYAWEHTLFTNGEKMLKGLEDKGFNKTYEEGTDFGLTFDEEVALTGDSANTVTVTFRGDKTSTMTYDEASGLYQMSQYRSEYKDAGNGERMSFRNVLVLYAEQWQIFDGQYYRSYYDLIGSGKGHMAIDGKIVPILWERPTLRDHFSYTLEDGTPVTLGVGKSYVGIVADSRTVSYE